jgi:hypothetical protein
MWTCFTLAYSASWVAARFVDAASAQLVFRAVLLTCALVTFAHVAKQLLPRLKFLTFREPKIPVGIVRRVTVSPEDCAEDGLRDQVDYDLYWWLAQSLMIVPYEHCVTFIDAKFKSANPAHAHKNFVLSSQEKQHSLIHGKYNRVHIEEAKSGLPRTARAVFCAYDRFLRFAVPLLNGLLPALVSGMVAVLEHAFFYSFTQEELFTLFFEVQTSTLARSAPLLSRIFAWHLAEEREHCAESTFLFNQHYGMLAQPLLVLVAGPALLFFMFTVSFTALVASIAARPQYAIQAVNAYLGQLLRDDALVIISTLLLLARLNGTDEHVDRDIALYREKFRAQTGLDLTTPTLNLSAGQATKKKF